MVAPLYVVVAVVGQGVHDDVRSGTAVVDVAEDVEAVDAQALYDLADGLDEWLGLAGGDDGVEDAPVVIVLVLARGGLVQQLLDDVGELPGEGLADLGARVLGRHAPEHLHQLVKRDLVYVLHVGLGAVEQLELLAGIVDEGAELVDVVGAHGCLEELADLALDVARGVLEDVAECLVLAVDIGHEVLGALGEVEDRLEVYDFRRRALDGAEALRQQLQQPPVLLDLGAGVGIGVFRHGSSGFISEG